MTVTRKPSLFSGERKTARATASIVQGSGRTWINGIPIELLTPEVAKERILTPLMLAGDLKEKVDIHVKVLGGGFMSRAEASAIAISRALVNWFKNGELKQRIVEFDKHLISGDPRQVEPKKFGGPGSRRRKQKSYR